MTYTVVERHMTLAQSKLNTSRGQSCTSEWYLVCGYTVLLEFNSGQHSSLCYTGHSRIGVVMR